MEPIAHIHSPYAEKFGVPRQSNLAPHVISEIVFEPPYRNMDCVRGMESFSHLWLIWQFHCNGTRWSPTVRPPRLGGNSRVGVFATRSPFRPNSLGLSVVRLVRILPGPVIQVSGADLVDGTPIFDIKPYVPYSDAVLEAAAGFTAKPWQPLSIRMEAPLPPHAPEGWYAALEETLAQDPRPAYQEDEQRDYFLKLKPYEIRFRVVGGEAVVKEIRPLP